MVWAAIPAFLRTRFNANEILTSLMLTYVAQLLLIYLVTGPWRDPEGYGFPQIAPVLRMRTLADPGRRHARASRRAVRADRGRPGWLVLTRSLIGFQLRVLGQAPRAARFAGFSEHAAHLAVAAAGRRRSPGLPACSRWPDRSGS